MIFRPSDAIAPFMSKRGNNETRRHTNRKRDETRLLMMLVVGVMIIMMIADTTPTTFCLFVCAGREEDGMREEVPKSHASSRQLHTLYIRAPGERTRQ
ncbi:hypothetical protein ACTXT7_010356 [Hymenolepis weldensis]